MRTPTVKIPLTQGYVAIIDAADAELVNQYKWYALKRGIYGPVAASKLKSDRSKIIFMHRLVSCAVPGCKVRWLNSNTLDNRRKNLLATPPRKEAA